MAGGQGVYGTRTEGTGVTNGACGQRPPDAPGAFVTEGRLQGFIPVFQKQTGDAPAACRFVFETDGKNRMTARVDSDDKKCYDKMSGYREVSAPPFHRLRAAQKGDFGMQEKPTMKNIAELLGISIGTVDRALKNRGRISESTRQQVLETADKLGYRVTGSAVGQPLHVVAIYPAKNEAFFNEISRGMSAALQEVSGMGVTLERMHTVRHSLISQQQLLARLEGEMDRWDALILAAAHPTALNETINRFVDAGKTVVTINSDAVGSKRLFFVGQDPFASGRTAANLMGELIGGAGKVALFTGFHSVWGHEERLGGFVRVMRERYPDVLLLGAYEYWDEEFAMRELLGGVLDARCV